MDPLVLPVDVELGHHHHVLGVYRAVGNPVLLGEGVRGVHDELLRLVVVGGSGLHLHGVVAVSELCQAEAANVIEIVNT